MLWCTATTSIQVKTKEAHTIGQERKTISYVYETMKLKENSSSKNIPERRKGRVASKNSLGKRKYKYK